MIKTEKYLYGTVEECVNEIWKRIDFDIMTMPSFDFCGDPYENTEDDLINSKNGLGLGERWYGCKANYDFDPQHYSLNIILGYYGGGDFYSVCICEDNEDAKRELIEKICDAAGIEADWDTVIEFLD